MRFQLLAARMAFAALILAVLAAAVAISGVRLGAFPYATGLTVMWPATGLGLVALICAGLWLRSAITRNEGTGKRIGMIALAGSLVFLYPPLSTVCLPREELGRRAVEALLRSLEGDAAGSLEIVVPTHFVPRGSTGPVAGGTATGVRVGGTGGVG